MKNSIRIYQNKFDFDVILPDNRNDVSNIRNENGWQLIEPRADWAGNIFDFKTKKGTKYIETFKIKFFNTDATSMFRVTTSGTSETDYNKMNHFDVPDFTEKEYAIEYNAIDENGFVKLYFRHFDLNKEAYFLLDHFAIDAYDPNLDFSVVTPETLPFIELNLKAYRNLLIMQEGATPVKGNESALLDINETENKIIEVLKKISDFQAQIATPLSDISAAVAAINVPF